MKTFLPGRKLENPLRKRERVPADAVIRTGRRNPDSGDTVLGVDLLAESFTQFARPAWLVRPDLNTVTANPAAQRHMEAHAGELPNAAQSRPRRQLSQAYERTFRAAIRPASNPNGQAADRPLPRRLTCLVEGRYIELLCLEIRDHREAVNRSTAWRPSQSPAGYLLVA